MRMRIVVRRMPVLREDDVLKPPRHFVDRLDNEIPARNGQRPTRAEIILHVDDEENVAQGDSHEIDANN